MNRIITIPNIISLARIVITIFAAVELYNGNNLSAFILYLTAVITDFLDGFLARLLNQVSNLGKVLDPIADKLAIVSALIILSLQQRAAVWYVLLVILLSVINLLGGLILIKRFKFVPSAIFIGKVAAVSVMLTFLLNIVDFVYICYLYYLSGSLLVVSFISYIVVSVRAVRVRN